MSKPKTESPRRPPRKPAVASVPKAAPKAPTVEERLAKIEAVLRNMGHAV